MRSICLSTCWCSAGQHIQQLHGGVAGPLHAVLRLAAGVQRYVWVGGRAAVPLWPNAHPVTWHSLQVAAGSENCRRPPHSMHARLLTSPCDRLHVC